MHKLTTVAVIVGLVTALTSVASYAATYTHGQQQPQTESEHVEQNCTEALLGYMRTPKAAEIQGLVVRRVAVLPVCEDIPGVHRNDYGPLFINGNAELLRLPIARNPALINALRAKDYDQNDVVSVRFSGSDSIIFYVHQRDMR